MASTIYGHPRRFSPLSLIRRENLLKVNCFIHTNINSFSNSNLLWSLWQNTLQKNYVQNFTFLKGLILDSSPQRPKADTPAIPQWPMSNIKYIKSTTFCLSAENHTFCTFSNTHADSQRGFNHAKQTCFRTKLRKDKVKVKERRYYANVRPFEAFLH